MSVTTPRQPLHSCFVIVAGGPPRHSRLEGNGPSVTVRHSGQTKAESVTVTGVGLVDAQPAAAKLMSTAKCATVLRIRGVCIVGLSSVLG